MPSPDVELPGVSLYNAAMEDVLPCLAEKSVDFVFTDPPYGHNNNNGDLISRREVALGGSSKDNAPRPILNDGPEADDLFYEMFGMLPRLLSGGCCCCCCCGGGGGPDPSFARWTIAMNNTKGMQFKQAVVWDKGPMGMGWHYRRSYEFVLVAQRVGGPCRWYDKTDAVENVIRPHTGIRRIIPRADQHPTEKPDALAQHFIRLHTQPGDVVLDPFMGAGSTGRAAVLDGRKFIGVELDREHFDRAVDRITRAVEAVSLGEPAAKDCKYQNLEFSFGG